MLTHCRQQVSTEQFRQPRGHCIGHHHCLFRQRAREAEVVREGLQAGALAQRERPILRRMDELRVGAACNRLRRLVWRQSSQSGRRSAAPFAWCSIHHASMRSAPVSVVPQMFRQVLHRLARTQSADPRRVHAPRRSEVVIGQRRAMWTLPALSRHGLRQSVQGFQGAWARGEAAAYSERPGRSCGAVRNGRKPRIPT